MLDQSSATREAVGIRKKDIGTRMNRVTERSLLPMLRSQSISRRPDTEGEGDWEWESRKHSTPKGATGRERSSLNRRENVFTLVLTIFLDFSG